MARTLLNIQKGPFGGRAVRGQAFRAYNVLVEVANARTKFFRFPPGRAGKKPTNRSPFIK